MSVNVVYLQKQTIDRLESLVAEQAKQIGELIYTNHNLSQVLHYLTDEKFRDFCFNINYNELINNYLINQ